jgi:excisionase family DNA binding protein
MDPYKRDGVWVIRWQDAAGRWHQKRTKCATKDQAKRLLDDLERQAERLRLGLETQVAAAPKMTFSELVEWWWAEYGIRLRGRSGRGFIDKHLLPELGGLLLTEVTPPRIEGLMVRVDRKLKAKSVNMLRGVIHRMFNLAIRRGLWNGLNPATRVERRKAIKRLPEYLRFDEVPRLIEHLPPQWRPLYATAVYTGMRQGELLGLRKSDIDMENGTITVARSYDHETTKGGHADVLPMAEELRPFIEEAFRTSPSPLLFPRKDGKMHSHETALDVILRRALGRAGIVTGYMHRCRRCGHETPSTTTEAGRCTQMHPKKPQVVCNMRLWARAIPRHVRFHDLRHTTATLLLKNGVPLATVQRLLRHTDPRLTSEVYGHLDVDDMRKAVNGLRWGQPLVNASGLGPAAEREKAAEAGPEETKLPGGKMLNMAQVAKALGVCRATAYRLIDSKALPHIRVSNAIRVSEAALKEFSQRDKHP